MNNNVISYPSRQATELWSQIGFFFSIEFLKRIFKLKWTGAMLLQRLLLFRITAGFTVDLILSFDFQLKLRFRI